MILSGSQILQELDHSIFITPFDESKLNSNSYNLTLSRKLKIYRDDILDVGKEYKSCDMTEVEIPEDGLVLQPHKLYLGSTVERTHTPKYIPIIEGRSSTARLGLFIHITAGLGEAGFDGHWTLELSCVQPLRIYPNISICQIYYHRIYGRADQCKSRKYQNSVEAQPSKLYKEIGGRE